MPKSVRFNQSCKLRLFASNAEVDQRNSWYSEDDYRRFKHESRSVVKAIHAFGGRVHDVESKLGESCYGLECMVQERAQQRTFRRSLVWDIVLGCQETLEDPETAAEQCSEISAESAADARNMAAFHSLSLATHLYPPQIPPLRTQKSFVSAMA